MLDVEIDLVTDFRTFGGLYGLGAKEGRNGYYDEDEGEASKHVGFS